MDIFDTVMSRPSLENIYPYYKKYKGFILYAFFGIATTVVSIGSFVFFEWLGIHELIANVFSWILAVMVAFLTNRVWVFHAPTHGTVDFIKQMIAFYSGRVVTLIIEELLLFVMITLWGWPVFTVKLICQVIIVILNYFISKLLVFGKGSKGKDE